MFDEYVTRWKSDRDAHGGSLASLSEDLGGQTRLGVDRVRSIILMAPVAVIVPCPSTATGDAIGRATVPPASSEKFGGEVSWRILPGTQADDETAGSDAPTANLI